MTTRIWEPFLTERDRLHLASAGPPPRYGFGERPVVLSVDNYRGALGDEPLPLLEAIRVWPSATGLEGWEALTRVSKLLEAARSVDVPVAHVTGLAESDSNMSGWRPARSGDPAQGSKEDQQQRRFDFMPEAEPIPGEVVFKKNSPSAFRGTPLLSHLVALRADTIVVCGESTSGCVRATVVDARSFRFNVVVVEDAVYDRHEASHAMSLFDMNQKYADVISLQEVLAYLSSQGDGR